MSCECMLQNVEELLNLSSGFIVLCTLSYNKYIPDSIMLNRTFTQYHKYEPENQHWLI